MWQCIVREMVASTLVEDLDTLFEEGRSIRKIQLHGKCVTLNLNKGRNLMLLIRGVS